MSNTPVLIYRHRRLPALPTRNEPDFPGPVVVYLPNTAHPPLRPTRTRMRPMSDQAITVRHLTPIQLSANCAGICVSLGVRLLDVVWRTLRIHNIYKLLNW